MSKKVTFTLTPEIIGDATEALLLGDFNKWDFNEGTRLKVQKDGSLKATLALEPGKTYQYRYLLNNGRWVNDANADYYVFDHIHQVDNCVIAIPVTEKPVGKATKQSATEKTGKSVKAAKPKAEAKTKAAAPAKDDLTKIEGIGKKIAELLAAENIISYKDLSKASVSKLTGILEAAGSKFKVHNPASWPRQAKLAAAGKFEELGVLQAELKGGK